VGPDSCLASGTWTDSCGVTPAQLHSKQALLNNLNWLVVSTHLKNISQIGSFPQIGVKIKMFETTT